MNALRANECAAHIEIMLTNKGAYIIEIASRLGGIISLICTVIYRGKQENIDCLGIDIEVSKLSLNILGYTIHWIILTWSINN